MSLLLTKQIIQMFLMMFCGWMIVRLGLLKAEESRALSVITIFIICPASVLNAFQIDYTPEIAENFRLALGSGVMIHVLVFLAVYALNLVFRVSGIAALAPDGRTVLFISLLACMTPTATSVTQMAQLYNSEPGYATAINTVTTMMCLVTMPLMTLLYEL